MSDDVELTFSRESTPPNPPAPEAAPGVEESIFSTEEFLSGPDRSSERVTIYWVVFLILLAGAFFLRDDVLYGTSSQTHTLLESLATLLAFVIGGLSLVRFYSRKQATFLYIGTGFIGAGLLDLNHALLTHSYFMELRELVAAVEDQDLIAQDLFAWSWTAERVFLSLFLAMSVLAWRKESGSEEGDTLQEGSVFGTALVLTLINLFFFEYFPLSRAHNFSFLVSRPAEFLPAAFFLAALFGYLMKGSWRRDAFEHWLIISLLISVLCHAAFMVQSEQRFDAMFDAAHMLKIASYLAILAGLLISVYVTFKREGQVLGALSESNAALEREVEVRARTEQIVKESSARLQDFLDNANDLIQSVDGTGKILYVNSSWKRVLGYSDQDLEKLNLFDIVNPSYRKFLEEEFRRTLEGEATRRFSIEYVAADGRMVILSGSAQPQHIRGMPVATQGIFRDVTEQRSAERQLAESRANLGALVENTGDAIWSVDRELKLITFNSAYALAIEAQTGREPKQGDLPLQVYGPENAEWYREMYLRTLSGERHVALREDTVEGHHRYFELYANPIQAFEGVSGAVFFGKDVTPRVRAEEALRIAKEDAVSANKAKSDFLASMSHELRTPLNSIIGFTNILLKNKDGRFVDKDLGFLNRVLSNGKHLLALINEVLDLAKVEAGRMELIIEEVDLAHLAVETVQQLEGQAKAKDGHVKLIADVPDEVELVDTDPAKLKQVIINLVGNALKFTSEGSVTLRLETAADGRTPIALSVIDTGIGIAAERLDAIFEAFQQAEAGTSRKYGGTGLGLALSRSICLLMGYDLIVESELGKGSTFKIVIGERAKRADRVEEDESSEEPHLVSTAGTAEAREAAPHPVAEPEATPEPAPANAESALKDTKVLVIDDEKDSRVLMVHYLEEFGCQVITAPGGVEGLQAARDHQPDLITLDLMMPGMTGWQVLKELKADPELKEIPVVVVSIVAGEGRGRLLGAVDLITKPFEREDLLRVLWRHLVRTRAGRCLVIDEDPLVRKMVASHLGELGLEAVAAAEGQEGLDKLRSESPDAVIIDLHLSGMGGIEFLRRLRAQTVYMGLPVFVLSAKEITDDEQRELLELASAVIPKKEALESLETLLGTVFKLPGADDGHEGPAVTPPAALPAGADTAPEA